MTTEPSGIEFTVSKAAAECGVHRNTIKRRLQSGAFPNAHTIDNRGTWAIPLADLLAAGLNPGKPTPPDSQPDSETQDETTAVLQERIQGLNAQLDERSERIHDLKAASTSALAQLETLTKTTRAIEAAKQTADNRLIDLTDTNARLAADKTETDKRYEALSRDEIKARKEVHAIREDAHHQLSQWRAATYYAIAALIVLAGLLVFTVTT